MIHKNTPSTEIFKKIGALRFNKIPMTENHKKSEKRKYDLQWIHTNKMIIIRKFIEIKTAVNYEIFHDIDVFSNRKK